MAKDRIERDELTSKLIETASSAEDPLRAMAELLTEFVMEAEVTAKVGACLRLIGMLLVEIHEDWLTDDKAYLTFDDAPAEEPVAKVMTMAVGE